MDILLSIIAILFFAWGVVSIGLGLLTKSNLRWPAVSMGSAFVSVATLFTYAIG